MRRPRSAGIVSVLVLALIGIVLVSARSGVPAAVWSLKGNSGTEPGDDFLGTSDNHPLIVKTNSTPVLTLGSDGPVEVHKALIVHGDETVDRDLRVGRNFSAAGGVSLGGSLTLNGDLAVSGQAQFAQDAHVAGNLTAATMNVSGTTTTGVLEITGGDLAEPFSIYNSDAIPDGAVVVIDDKTPGRLNLSTTPYDRRVAGVISGAGGIASGVIMYWNGDSDLLTRHVALAGRVYALADATPSAIRPGDLLTSSAVPGHLMKVTDYQRAQGAVVGKAMSSLDTGEGLVLVLISLQ